MCFLIWVTKLWQTVVHTIPALNDSRQNFILASKTVKEMYHRRKSGHRIPWSGQKHKPPILPHTYHPRNTQRYPSNTYLQAGATMRSPGTCRSSPCRVVGCRLRPTHLSQPHKITAALNFLHSVLSQHPAHSVSTARISAPCVCMKYALGEMALDAFLMLREPGHHHQL